jgi:hypothetical protein
MMRSLLVVLVAALSFQVHGFSMTKSKKSRVLFASDENEPQKNGGFFFNFFKELDAFVDDATSRRLGAGSAFYGKRKSNFYGADDKGRKMNRDMPDPTGELTKMWSFWFRLYVFSNTALALILSYFCSTEDYQGPSQSGYFKWMPDENGQLKPVTRMKEKVVERNPNYWDRVYSEKDE